jgi:hypothetical protein
MYDNNVVIILNEKQTNLKIKLKNIDRVIVNKVRLYSNRSTVQGSRKYQIYIYEFRRVFSYLFRSEWK